MIQELLNIKEDQKPALPPLDGSPSSSASAAAAAESLRCPRCDSANTKFCYYNNYNLTQPRHFCKTCRRYWTKGGALRNVPIGGGCRKNKSSPIAAAVAKSPGKLQKTLSSEMARTAGGLFTGFETAHHHHHNSLSGANPNLMWGPPPNHNNFLSLLRANQNPNHNYPNHHHQGSSNNNNNYNHFRVSGLDPTLGSGHAPSPVFRNQPGQGPTHGGGGEAPPYNGQLQDLYQRLRSSAPSTGCYFPENAPLIGSITSANYTSLANSAILESAPVGTAGELGFWNASSLSLPTHDVPTANGTGAYPA